MSRKKRKKKSTKLNWADILIRALVDLIVGTVLVLIGKLIG